MIGRLQSLGVGVQVSLLLAATPVVVALFGAAFAPAVVDVAMPSGEREATIAATAAVRAAVLVLVVVAALTSLAAWAVLRGCLRDVVEQMRHATEAIADGRFRHRIATTRRDELGGLAGAVDAMAERLELLEQARRSMLACVSHELRTPVTIVRGHAYTLARHSDDPPVRERLQLIEAEAVRLGALVDQLVDASCLAAGGVELARDSHDLVCIAREAADRMAVAAAEHALTIRVVAPARDQVRADLDEARVQQVLANLLANAVRHAHPGSVIDVAVGWSEGVPTLAVRNCGDPIAPVDADRIFAPFEQVGTVRGSVGLGLAIVRGIVEAHGGGVQLAQDVDAGWVELRCTFGREREERGVTRSSRRVQTRRFGAPVVGASVVTAIDGSRA